MTRAVTIIALTCFLVVGAAATSILGRASVPDASPQAAAQVSQNPVSNKEAKKDKLAVATLALASFDPAPSQSDLTPPDATKPDVTRSLRMAYAAQQSPAADIAPPQITSPQAVTPAAMPQAPLASPLAPKVAAKPAPQKSYTLLSDAQIAGIKERLKLSPDRYGHRERCQIRTCLAIDHGRRNHRGECHGSLLSTQRLDRRGCAG